MQVRFFAANALHQKVSKGDVQELPPDAQTQLLSAEISLVNATYGFLTDLIAAEQTLSTYPFLQPPAEVEELLDQLTDELALQP